MINKTTELRTFIANQLEKLTNGKIRPEQANACAMLSANMLLSVKLEMDYARMKGEKPNIAFMEDKKSKLIEHK